MTLAEIIEKLEEQKALIQRDIADYPRWGAYLTAKAEELRDIERRIESLRAREASDG